MVGEPEKGLREVLSGLTKGNTGTTSQGAASGGAKQGGWDAGRLAPARAEEQKKVDQLIGGLEKGSLRLVSCGLALL